jgi:hypothetical protein
MTRSSLSKPKWSAFDPDESVKLAVIFVTTPRDSIGLLRPHGSYKANGITVKGRIAKPHVSRSDRLRADRWRIVADDFR